MIEKTIKKRCPAVICAFSVWVCGVIFGGTPPLENGMEPGSDSGFSLGGIGKELECNNIDLYRYRRKGSLLIQTLYLRDRDRERGKNRRFHIVLLIEKSI